MELSEAVEIIRKHENFVDQPKAYLAHGFIGTADEADVSWQVGYYNPDTDEITSYVLEGTHVTRTDPAEVFKEGGVVAPFDLKNDKVGRKEALRIGNELLASEHPQHPKMKTILLLQNDGVHHMYNLTIVTKTLHMLNVKINSASGEVISSELASLLELAQE